MAKEITYTVKANVDGVEKTIKKTANTMDNLNEAVSKYEGLLGKAEVGSKSFNKIKGRLKDLKKEQEKATIASQSFGETMTSIPGPIGAVSQGVSGLGTTMKALAANPVIAFVTLLVGGLKLLFNAFKSTKKGGEQVEQLMAGVSAAMDVLRDVAVVVAEKLISVFKNPKQALIDLGKSLKQNIINRFTGMLELIPAVGKAIGLAFKGKFKEAGKVAVDAVGKVALGVENVTDKAVEAGNAVKETFDEIKEESKIGASVKKELQSIADAQRELNVRRAEQNKEIALAKERINDENLSYEDRIKALNDVAAAEKKLADEETALAKRKLDAMEAEAALSDSNAETLDAIAAQKQLISNLEMASAQKSKEVADQALALTNRQKAEEKAAADERQRMADEEQKKKDEQAAADLDRKRRTLDAEIELLGMADEIELEKLKEKLLQRMELELENEELTEAERLLIREQYAELIGETEEAVTEKKKEESKARIQAEIDEVQAMANGAAALATIFGEETMAGKAAASAAAMLNTYAGAAAALNDETIPNTFLRIVAAGAVIANGLKQLQTINSTDISIPKPKKPTRMAEGGLVTGGGTPTSDTVPALLSPGESVINAQSTAAFSPLLDSINRMGGGKPIDTGLLNTGSGGDGNGMVPIVKTYVVSTDMTDQQQLDRQIKTRSTI